MNDAQYETQKARVMRRVVCWQHNLWLGQWRIEMEWHRGALPTEQETSDEWEALFRISVRWQYMKALMKVNLPAVGALDEDDLDELLHCVVNEMRWVKEGIEHEERVVTHLQKIMTWSDSFVRMTEAQARAMQRTWDEALSLL